jgi:hypothetical protein
MARSRGTELLGQGQRVDRVYDAPSASILVYDAPSASILVYDAPSASIFAAQIKSFSCSPPMAWV